MVPNNSDMENFQYDLQVDIAIKKLDERREVLSTNQPSSFGIDRLNVYFKCKTQVSLSGSCPRDIKERLLVRGTQPLMVKPIHIDYDHQEILPLAKTHFAIREQLQEWEPIPYDFREKLIVRAISSIGNMVKLITPPNNVLDVGMQVIIEYNGAGHRKQVIARAMPLFRMEIDYARSRLQAAATDLPTTNDNITEYYSEKDCDEDCPICLEGVFQCGRVALFLRCTHKFHGYCIAKWLSRNPTCPVCRSRQPRS